MKRLHWLFFMMCLAVLPALQSCDDLDDGYSIGDFSYPNWSTVRVKGNTFYLESDTWGTLWPINTNMGWYQPVDGQRIITIFNPIYDNYEGYDHAVKIEKIWHALTKSVEPLTSENDEEYGNDPVFIYKGGYHYQWGIYEHYLYAESAEEFGYETSYQSGTTCRRCRGSFSRRR